MKDKTKRLHALQKQMTRLNRRMERLKRLSDRFSWFRLGSFLGGMALGIFSIMPSIHGWAGECLAPS
ncbi:MAG: hypothetical protein ACE5HI_08405 [bacterium]